MIGHTFGSLRVEKLASVTGGRAFYLCRCVCGGERYATAHELREGKATACRACSRRASHERAARVARMSREQIVANWIYHLEGFTHRQRAAYRGRLDRRVQTGAALTDELRAETVADVLMEWARRALASIQTEGRAP